MAVSAHLKWLATGGPDGKMILRATGAIVSKLAFKFKFNACTEHRLA